MSWLGGSERYKALVLRGEAADGRKLTKAGQELCWHDFVQLVRALAHLGEPVALPDGVHAQAISGLIHLGLIHRFGSQSRAQLIVLHQAPYGSVPAERQ